ncbi:unnamed protein product [Brassica oleracea var. botrytis]
MEGLSGSAGCAVSSDGSFVLLSQFTKSNIKRYWIKGPKAGSSEDFTNSVSNPDNIKRIGSTGNFWIASVVNKIVVPTNPSAVKVNSNGEVLQTIPLKDQFGDTLLSEVNEFDGSLYIGTLTGPFAGSVTLSLRSGSAYLDNGMYEEFTSVSEYRMTLYIFLISLLLLSLLSAVVSDDASFQKLPVPGKRSGPESFAFDSTGKDFYTGVSGGKILKYTPDKGFVDFAQITKTSTSSWCKGVFGTALAKKCGRPAGIAFNPKTGDLYVADAPLGLHVIHPAGGVATKIADSVDGKPFKFLDGLDVDPTTGVVYFTSFSSKFSPSEVFIAVGVKDASGKLFKYDPATKAVTVLMEDLSGAAGCAVSSDGSFVLVSEFIKSNIKRYWIKGPKAGSTDDIFSSSVSNPDNIRRIGSTGNFWVASVINKVVMPTDPSAVKIDSNGKVLQTIFLKNEFGNTLLSEANEVDGKLYIGTLTGPFAGVMKL